MNMDQLQRVPAIAGTLFPFSAIRVIWYVLSCLAAFSCSAKREHVTLSSGEELRFSKPKTFYPKHSGLIAYFDDSLTGREHYYFLYNSQLTLYHAVLGQAGQKPDNLLPTQAIALNHLFRNTNNPLEAMGVASPDSLVFVDGSLHNICLTDSRGTVRQQWQPRAPIYGRTRYFIDTSLEPIYCHRGMLYLRCGPEIGSIITDSLLFRQFLSYKSGLVLKPSDTTFASNKAGAFPSLLSAKNNYNITGSAACVSPTGHYIFSYGPFSELHDYDLSGNVKVADVPSRYHRPAAGLPFSALTNRQALTNYKLTEPEYGRIISDPYRHCYLRVYMHGLPDAGTKSIRPKYADMPWSLMIINEDFEKIGEIKFASTYDPRLIIVTRRGVLIGNRRPEHPGYDPQQLSFQFFTYQTIQHPSS